MPLARLLNVIYAYLAEGASVADRKELDENLARDPSRGPKSRGANQLLALMGGGGRPAGAR